MNEIATTNRRGALSKKRILETTMNLLQAEDYQTVSLDRIAKEAGIAKSSILWHFGSKDLLVTEALQTIFYRLEQEVLGAPLSSECPVDRLSEILEYVTGAFENNKKALAVILNLVLTPQRAPEVRKLVAQAWKQYQESIVIKLSTDRFTLTPEMSVAILALIHGCYVQWYLDDFKSSLDDMMQSAVDMLKAMTIKDEHNEEATEAV